MFSNIFTSIGKAISAGFLFIAMLGGGHATQAPTTLGGIQPAADFTTSLVSGITSSATSMTLVSTSTPSGENLVQGATYGFKLGGQEYVLGTLSAGKQITGLTRGVSLITGTTTGGVAQAWGRGTAVEITDAPILLQISNKVSGTEYFDNVLTYASSFAISSTSNQIPTALWVTGVGNTASTTVDTRLTALDALDVHLAGIETITGVKTFSSKPVFSAGGTFNSVLPQSSVAPTTGNDLVNKTYADGLSFAGAPNSDESTKGISQLATKAQASLGTSAGSSGARLVLPASMATSTSQTATTSLVMTDTTGKISPTFLSASSNSYTITNLSVVNSTSSATSTAIIGSFPAYQIGKNMYATSTSGTVSFTVPSGIKILQVTVVGAGAGGGGTASSNGHISGGGGGGSCSIGDVDVSGDGGSVTLTVGAGGTAGSSGSGGNGGTTSFGSHITSLGGNGGQQVAAVGGAGTGGTSSGGTFNTNGGDGFNGFSSGTSVGFGGNGGASCLGGGGKGGISAGGVGTAGSVPGSGGGGGGEGSSGSPVGGKGADGAILISW